MAGISPSSVRFLVNTDLIIAVCDLFFVYMLYSLSHRLLLSPFLAFFVVFALLVRCCFFAWMRTAILAGGLRSSAPAIAFCFAEDGELAFTFCSLATGLLGRTALGEKKPSSVRFDRASDDVRALDASQPL